MAQAAVSAPTWFVKIGVEVFGPYPDAHLSAYVAEGRLQARTLIGESPRGPFAPLGEHPLWADSFVSAVLQPVMGEAPEAAPDTTAHRAAPALRGDARPNPRPDRVADPHPVPARAVAPALAQTAPEPALEEGQFFVLCEGAAEAVSAVAAALAELGATAPATGASWFLSARTTADTLRNTLSRRAPPSAKLVILDLSRNEASWFNLGANRDAAIRRLRPPPAHPPRG